jgi:hypothetical protein
MSENSDPKQRRGVTLRTPGDVRRLIQRICSRAFQEEAELEHAGRISQLLGNWLKAWELEKVSDIEARLTALENEVSKR